MADSTLAFFLQNPTSELGAGAPSGGGPGGMYPETMPALLWGQGTPNGDLAPFNLVNKGSIYLCVNAADDTSAVWQKVDEGGDNADWVQLAQTGAEGPSHTTISTLYDISAADSEQVVLYAKQAITIRRAYLLWEEATGASGAAEGDITIGTATGGAQIVAAAAYAVSKASGSVQDLTLVTGALTAAQSVFASHDIATGAAGTYRLVLEWDYT